MISRFERPEPYQVSLDLTQYLQGIAFRGWSKSLYRRKAAEIRNQFNNKNLVHLNGVKSIYESYAARQGLLLAYDDFDPDPIGFALTDSEVSGNPVAQFIKRRFRKSHIFAHIRHLCIDADHQGQGNFRPLVHEAMASPEFWPEQIPTAHIFEENSIAIRAFASVGFRRSPVIQSPVVLNGYFGPGDPAVQIRYAGPSVAAVKERSEAS
jgi:GNAT superfamily N-acetyltransferase